MAQDRRTGRPPGRAAGRGTAPRGRGRSASRVGCAALTSVALLAGAVGGVVWFLDGRAPDAASRRCTAGLDGTDWGLSVDQADNAALIAAMSLERGLPARAATIALATALQESRLINIDYGDRDSVGLFQQRPSQGWGTVEQIMDPVYSAGKFYDGLVAVPGYTELPVTEAAQAVQRSGFPDAYAQHEVRSRAWASALTGWSTATLTCDLDAPTVAGSVDLVAARVARDFAGTVPAAADAARSSAEGTAVRLDSSALAVDGDTTRSAWAVAQWAVSVADEQQVVAVEVGDARWLRTEGADPASAWQSGVLDEPVPEGSVVLVLAP
ncbi:MAG TPA: hypothetical protein VGC57_02395 [Cellulomonas sp.]